MIRTAMILSMFMLFTNGQVFAQEEKDLTATETESTTEDTVAAAIQDLAPKTNHVFVIFTDSKPDQIIILDENGKWIPDVKSITIEMTIGEQPTCTCTIWSGFYKPTNPTTKTWPLKQARSASPEEFQNMIDKLQKDEAALAAAN